MRIKSLPRLINFISILIALTFLLYFSSSTTTYSNPIPKKVIVRPGDNVWKIAQKYYPNENLLNITYEIETYNNLHDGTIYPGQIIYLP